MEPDDSASRRSILLRPLPKTTSFLRPRPSPSFWTRILAWVAVGASFVGVALYFVWVYLEYAPNNPWKHDIEDWKIPRGGPEASYVQQLLMASSLALAAVAASTSELLVGLRLWQWQYVQRSCWRLQVSLVEAVLWFLILGSIVYWFFYEEVTELKLIYWPSASYSYADYGYSYDTGSGNDSDYSYTYGEDHHQHAPPRASPPDHGGGGEHHHQGPPHFGPEGPKWLQAMNAKSPCPLP